MSDNANKTSAKAVLIILGIAFLIGGFKFNSGFLIMIGFISFVIASFFSKSKSGSAANANIRSGNIQSYHTTPHAGSTANYSTSYKIAAQDEVNVDLLAEEMSNSCPICKEFSAAGYCSRCGFKYKK